VDASLSQAACPPACGLAYTVTSTGDGDLVGPSTQCDDGTGHCTLRAAITAANLHSGDDGILFDIPTTDPGYNATYGGWFIQLTKALPDIASNVSINGPGAAKLAVQGIQSAPGIRIFNVTATGTVSFSGIRIGTTVLYTAGFHGAGIQNVNAGTINITDCLVDNNSAAGDGAGVYNNTGVVNISGTTFREDNTDATGGAIFNGSGTINISNCLLQDNFAQGPTGGGASGGAISNGTGKVNVTSSTISFNFANSGAIASLTSGGVISLANCTLSRNEAQGGGGAITVTDGTVNLTNCTISGNFISNSPNRGAGGILVTAPGTVKVKNTLIAKNTATGFNVRPELSGTFVSQGFNLVGDPSGSDGFNAPTDHTGTFSAALDPKLDPEGLQNNGGPTKTIALLFGSPAIDQGAAGIDPITGMTLTTDQRGEGFARKFDDPNVTNASSLDGTDIGAFEMQTTPTTLANVSTRLPVQTGDNVLFAGFIITGTHDKKVAIVGLGPSLSQYFTGVLADPVLELYNGSGLMESNDNWVDSQKVNWLIHF
jgi:CSLREA domain-containing protein